METPFWMLRIKWAYQEGSMRRRFLEWAAWEVAFVLPRKVALFAFIRVYAATCDSPGPEYDRAYRAWEAQ